MNHLPNNFAHHRNGTASGTVLTSHYVSHPVQPLFPGSVEGSYSIITAIVSISPSYSPRITTTVNMSATVTVSSVP